MSLGDPNSLAEAAQALADRRISSVELTEAALRRAETRGRALNAFVAIDRDGALAAARPRGMPMLDDSLASFECAIAQRLEVGTHTVLFCTVETIVNRAGRDPMIYFDRTYMTIGRLPELQP